MSNVLKCPHCGQMFNIDDSHYASILAQVRTVEFQHDVESQVAVVKHSLETQYTAKLDRVETEHASEMKALRLAGEKKEFDLTQQYKLAVAESDRQHADAMREQERRLTASIQSLQSDNMRLQNTMSLMEEQKRLAVQTAIADTVAAAEKEKNELTAQLAYYRDFKTRMSTKMVGESLERYCENEFNRVRAMAFDKRNVRFEKDNDVSASGSKGDYIYREYVDDIPLLSIMFEMKNETDTTSTKHKNTDFLKELDKDRKEKNCEYAVLVSLLEPDNDFYNQGIVECYQYEKMYIVRPQFFLPIISVLRGAAMNSLDAYRETARLRQMNLDVTQFEKNLDAYHESIARNQDLLSRKHQEAIDEIDAAIAHLTKVKEALQSSSRNVDILARKAEDLTVRKLGRGAPETARMILEASGHA